MSGISVIIPNWNRRDLLERLLERLRTQTTPIEEVLVVDNGSGDGSQALAEQRGARLIALPHNAGFAGAVNRGIQEARTERIAVLNNDVEPAPDWLEHLARGLDQPGVGYATGKLLNAQRPEWLDGTYDTICRGACAWHAGHGRRDGPVFARQRRVRLVPFTAALFRAEVFRKVGLLDERFGSYLEDVDFGLRCAAAGCGGLYEPRAVATHIGSATLGAWHKETVRLIARNQVLLVAKHYPARYFLRYGWSILVAQLLWGMLALRHGRLVSFVRGKVEGAAQFHRARRDSARVRGLSRILEQSEMELFRIQRRTGFDLYWRLYFALTSLQ